MAHGYGTQSTQDLRLRRDANIESTRTKTEPKRCEGIHRTESDVNFIGLYGWRERCLVLVVLLLVIVIGVNMFLTIWIMNELQFSLRGVGRLSIFDGGVKLTGQADFFNNLYTNQIHSEKREAINLRSKENITLHTRSSGTVNGRLNLGRSEAEVTSDRFTVKNANGKILFYRDGKNVIFGVDTLKISGQRRRITVIGAIQTPAVRAEDFQPLRCESLTRKIDVKGPEGVSLESKRGSINVTSAKNLHLPSSQGYVHLISKAIHLNNLRMALPTNRGRSYPGIYQLCICEKGRLFAAPPTSVCSSDVATCI